MKRETKMFLTAELIVFIILLLMILCSCATKKVVETVAVHDTVYSHQIDTIVNEKVVHKVDTIQELVEKIITLKVDSGKVDTLRQDITHNIYKYVYLSDSTKNFKSVVDTLLKAMDKQHEKTITKEKGVPWKWVFAFLAIFAVCIIVLKSK